MGISVLLAGNLSSSPGRPPGLSTDSGSIPGLDFSALLTSQLTVSPEIGKQPPLQADTPEWSGLPVDIDATTGAQPPQTILTQNWAQEPEKLLASLLPPAPSSTKPEAAQEETTGAKLLRVDIGGASRLENSSPDEAGPAQSSLAQNSAPITTAAIEHRRTAKATDQPPLQEPPRSPTQQQAERLAVAAPTLQAAVNTTAEPLEAPQNTFLPQAARAELSLPDKKTDPTLPSTTRTPAPGTFAEALAGRAFLAADGNGAPAIVAAESGSGHASPINSVGIPGEKGHVPGNPVKDGPAAIHTPLHDPRWNQQLGDRVLWMARGEAQTAQINITPAQLGPIKISISLQGDQMTAQFISAHQEVRQALEDAMPRLREMLSGAGINLGQANVGAQQQQRDTRAQFAATVPSAGEEAILPGDASRNTLPAQPLHRGRGMIDLFA